MKTKYKFIHFYRVMVLKKTEVWVCCNIRTGGKLGEVKWYSAWRQYCFFPKGKTVFNISCLEDIRHFIGQLKK